MKNNAFAVVTGASQGLGKSFAIALAKRKYNVILISLPNQNLKELSVFIKEKYKVKVIYYEIDFSSNNDTKLLAKKLQENHEIDILINNAGTGGTRRLEDVSLAYLNTIIQVNIQATTTLIHQLLPNLKRQPKAYILNVSSMAAFSPLGYKTIYPASKAFVHSFSIGLSEELKNTSVSVSVINPGPMKTNPEITARIEKQGALGKLTLLEPEKVAEYSLKKMLKGRTLILVNPISWFFSTLLPTWIKVPMMTNIIKREV
ncbi:MULTISPECIES: SDR family NAD(P)-dependent oxidoreductase [unclassified Tenacibaculum]|uniref:SDR family NAD(P)-dependent oxidoreductase n=1 Tax=unclassified Tenacibaculum TaxID=2635139 RepID=UPI001F1588E2|nr:MULTISPECIES: SDR family NAD(P)-dependent oxidoreductase [unclassified Tenacibaculum]MCF2875733.1 SDR family NAD(P)-dependent oxidoreductase [Tenacibaculum sp. Cn5-1]MCF2935809.1 SDR family NAD(P)-dependent oxidoreductase [Tenacibaculum sp. Cn5-34]MCG7512369.1 SDR family NAD(P)-dependent oxidoreductase [Tenacibaculum sp. Cn5-46]